MDPVTHCYHGGIWLQNQGQQLWSGWLYWQHVSDKNERKYYLINMMVIPGHRDSRESLIFTCFWHNNDVLCVCDTGLNRKYLSIRILQCWLTTRVSFVKTANHVGSLPLDCLECNHFSFCPSQILSNTSLMSMVDSCFKGVEMNIIGQSSNKTWWECTNGRKEQL